MPATALTTTFATFSPHPADTPPVDGLDPKQVRDLAGDVRVLAGEQLAAALQ
jgi:hypothetical protein